MAPRTLAKLGRIIRAVVLTALTIGGFLALACVIGILNESHIGRLIQDRYAYISRWTTRVGFVGSVIVGILFNLAPHDFSRDVKIVPNRPRLNALVAALVVIAVGTILSDLFGEFIGICKDVLIHVLSFSPRLLAASLCGAGIVLFVVRKYFRVLYSLFELAAGVSVGLTNANLTKAVPVTHLAGSSDWRGFFAQLSSGINLAVLTGSLYLIVRALDNLETGLREAKDPDKRRRSLEVRLVLRLLRPPSPPATSSAVVSAGISAGTPEPSPDVAP